MEIKRDSYLEQVKSYAWDGQVKVITGIRRCGKSYLLRTLYRNYLLEQGVSPDNIITIELDLARDIRYRNPLALAAHVRSIVEKSTQQFYLFVDEIQMSDEMPNPYNEYDQSGSWTPDGGTTTLPNFKTLLPAGLAFVVPAGVKSPIATWTRGGLTSMTGNNVKNGKIETRFDLNVACDVAKGQEHRIGCFYDTSVGGLD